MILQAITRRTNHTERQRILHEHAKISLRQVGGDYCFDLELELASYAFPADARIRVEAWRGSAAQHWNWGRVGAPREPKESERILRNVSNHCQFKVSVVAGDGSGLLKGVADKIKPKAPVESLLPLDQSQELGDEVWKLDFGGGDDQVVLQVNRGMPDLGDIVRRDPAFHALAMPQILRSILERAMQEGADPSDAEGPWKRWLEFARATSGQEVPDMSGEDRDDEAIHEWIGGVVAAFAKKHKMLASYKASHREGAS